MQVNNSTLFESIFIRPSIQPVTWGWFTHVIGVLRYRKKKNVNFESQKKVDDFDQHNIILIQVQNIDYYISKHVTWNQTDLDKSKCTCALSIHSFIHVYLGLYDRLLSSAVIISMYSMMSRLIFTSNTDTFYWVRTN